MKDRFVFAVFRAGERLFPWVRRRFTHVGQAALVGLLASAVWGVDTNQSMAYQAFTFLAALLVLSCALARLRAPRARLSRRLPRFATAGEPIRYGIAVENLGTRPLRGLAVREELADPRPDFEAFHAAPDPPDPRFFWLDRFSGYSRWRRLIEAKSAVFEEALAPDLAPGGAVTVDASLTPRARGRLELGALMAAEPDPLGLARGLAVEPVRESILVLPRRYRVPHLALAGTRRYQPGGVALAASVGESQEFVGLRDYRPGDPPRRIHWRSWAKTGRPIVKEHQDEYFVRHALALDTFGPPGEAFEEAVSVAASFACSTLTQDSLLDLLFIGGEAFCVTAGRGQGGADRLLEVLATVAPCPGRSFGSLAASVLRRREALSGCICIFLSYDAERRALVTRLQASGLPVTALVVRHQGAPAVEHPGVVGLEAGRIAEGLAKGLSGPGGPG